MATLPHIHGAIAGNLYIHVKNTSGVQLVRGTPIYITGNVGATDRVEVGAADFDDVAKMPAVGLLNQTLDNNGSGDAIILGELNNAATNAYSLNQELFVGNNGTISGSRPTTGEVQSIGVVSRVHSNTGVIVVNMQGRRSPNEAFALAVHSHTPSEVGLSNVTNTAQVTSVGGTAPIVSSGGTTPSLSISAATTSAAGSMSSADKTKLDGIAAGAEVNVQSNWTESNSGSDAFILNKPVLNGVITDAFPAGFGSGVANIDWQAASHWVGTLAATGGTTIVFQNVVVGKTITFDLTGNGYPAGWPAGITWIGGSIPTIASSQTVYLAITATSATTFVGAVKSKLASSADYIDIINRPTIVGGWGPLILNRFRGSTFANSGYAPNGQNPSGMFSLTPTVGNTVEGWGFDGTWPRIFNPARLLGTSTSWAVTAYVRASGVFNDGLHCQIRIFNGTTASIVSGLGDFGGGGSGTDRIYFATSSTLTTSDTYYSFALYLGAYNGGNGGVIQDTALVFNTV